MSVPSRRPVPQAGLLDLLSAYVPPMVQRWIGRTSSVLSARLDRFPAAVLLADLSGFTSLTERLSHQGDRGAETVQELLNLCFGQMIEIIALHGGEVSKFAGDAAIACWPAESDAGLGLAAARSAACGKAIQLQLDGMEAIPGTRLRLRVGIGAGEVWAACVGGVAGSWEWLLGGTPVEQAAVAQRKARPGQVVLSAEAAALVDGATPFTSRQAQGSRVPPSAAPIPALRAFIPPSLVARLEAGLGELLGEFRQVTTLFLGVAESDGSAVHSLDRLQALTRCLQEVVGRYGGCLGQLIVDDKGTVLVAGWGVPLHTYEDDAVRALLAALALRERLLSLGFAAGIGITTGRAFTGTRGNARRMEYAMIGAPVNLASRLMQAARGGVLCDAATRSAAGDRVQLQSLPALTVAGRPGDVEVFRPLAPVRRGDPCRKRIVGRDREQRILGEALEALAGGSGGVALLEAEAGMGKTLLVADLLEHARSARLFTCIAAAESLERSTPFYAFREPFAELLGWHGSGDPGLRRRDLLARLANRPDLQARAALLNPVLPFAVEESALTREMGAEARSLAARELMVHLFEQALEGRPALLVLEDAHWLDSSSWALAEALCRHLRLLLVIAARPLAGDEVGMEWRRLAGGPGARRLTLSSLPDGDARDLLASRLGVASVPAAVAEPILRRAEGHPYFLEELTLALKDRGLLRIEAGRCRLAPGVANLDSLDFPATLQGVIASRIDRLPPPHQLTLKVASVIGRGFDLATLGAAHPILPQPGELRSQLAALESAELLERDGSETAWLFRHAIVRDVAYGILTYAQRRPLHGAVARCLEQAAGGGPRPYPLLAHHWQEAGEAPLALECFTQAGEQALGNYANLEAARFFGAALELDRELGPEPRRRSLLELRLGKAFVNASDYGQARPHIQEGLDLLGLPVPGTTASQVSRVLLEILRQSAHRLWPGRLLGRGKHRRELLLAGAAAYEGLVEVCYYTNRPLLSFLSALRTLNLAETAGSSAELARSYALAGTMAGYIPLHGLAHAYCRRAEAIAQQTADPVTLLWVSVVNGVFYTGVGDWNRAGALYERAIALGRRLGDDRRWSDAVGNLADVRHFQSRPSEALELLDEMQASAVRRNDERYLLAALRSRAFCLISLDRFEEAWTCLEEVSHLASSGELAERELTELDLHGLGALVQLRLGNSAGARESANRATKLRDRLSSQVSFYSTVESCAAVAEVYLDLWELHGQSNGIRRAASRACRNVWKLARVFPIARPSAWWLQGRLEQLSGRPAPAGRSWQRCVRESRERAMPRYGIKAENFLQRLRNNPASAVEIEESRV